MGDRVLMQCFSSETGKAGPVLYLHDMGHKADAIARRLAARMTGRSGDVAYSSARLVQEGLVGNESGCLGIGVMAGGTLLTAADSHGDAGIVLIDVASGHVCKCLGGYLKDGPDGFPFDPRA